MLTIKDALKYPNAPLLDYTLSETQPFKHANVLAFLNGFHGNIAKCKLVLRSSTKDLTVEEEVYILRNFSCVPVGENISKLTNAFKSDDLMKILKQCDSNNPVDLVDYFRQQSIMIETDDWFELGKAVKPCQN